MIKLLGWRKQRNTSTGVIEVVYNLLDRLDFRITRTAVKNTLFSHPDHPSLAAVVDSLEQLGLESKAVECEFNNIHSLCTPSLAFIKNDNAQYFVMIKDIHNGNVEYFDPGAGWTKKTFDEFEKLWTGTLIIGTKQQRIIDNNYDGTRKYEIQEAARKAVIYLGCFTISGLIIGVSFVNSSSMPPLQWLLGVKLLGFCLSFMLVVHTFSKRGTRFCPTGPKLDCNSVLNSAAAKLFGLIPMADIGVLYFLGGILTIFLYTLQGELITPLPYLTLISSLALPYTLFSVIYQTFVVRKWCWLCISVMVIFWVEFFVGKGSLGILTNQLELESLLSLVLGFGLPILLWVAFKYPVEQTTGLLEKFYYYKRLENNPLFIAAQLGDLKRKSPIDLGSFPNDFRIGNDEAPFRFTLVLSPDCEPCASEFIAMNRLLYQFPELVSLNIRFLSNNNNDESPVRHLMVNALAHAIAGDSEAGKKLLLTWFIDKKRSKDRKIHFLESEIYISKDNATLGNNGRQQAAEQLLSAQNKWARDVGIIGTPTMLLDQFRLPFTMNANRLWYYLKGYYEENQLLKS